MKTKVKKKKIKIKKKLWLILISLIVLVFLGLSIFYLINHNKKAISFADILDNLNEYDNPLYLNSLTQQQKNYLINSLDQSFYEKCTNKERCIIPFLFVYMDVKLNLGIPSDKILEGKESMVMSVYADLPHNLTEDDLRGFTIPFLTRLCRIGVLNQTEKSIWTERIIDIEKTDTSLDYKKISYFIECMNTDTIYELSKVTYIDLDKLNEKICGVSSNINFNDPCQVLVYLRTEKFCGVEITTSERSIVDILLSNEYKSYYTNNCKEKLSNFIFQ